MWICLRQKLKVYRASPCGLIENVLTGTYTTGMVCPYADNIIAYLCAKFQGNPCEKITDKQLQRVIWRFG